MPRRSSRSSPASFTSLSEPTGSASLAIAIARNDNDWLTRTGPAARAWPRERVEATAAAADRAGRGRRGGAAAVEGDELRGSGRAWPQPQIEGVPAQPRSDVTRAEADLEPDDRVVGDPRYGARGLPPGEVDVRVESVHQRVRAARTEVDREADAASIACRSRIDPDAVIDCEQQAAVRQIESERPAATEQAQTRGPRHDRDRPRAAAEDPEAVRS